MSLRSSIVSQMAATTQMSQFNQAVVAAMRKLYPEALADKTFDNNGLLLESPRQNHVENHALLTIDLTKAVADEAIAHKCSIVVAYHPIIFKPLKALTLANSQQSTLLRLAQEGISVYSPHTAVDAAVGGINDWLADMVVGKNANGDDDRTYYKQDYDSDTESVPGDDASRSVITAVKNAPDGHEEAGYGRIIRFATPVPLGIIVKRISSKLKLKLSVAIPQSLKRSQGSEVKIASVGICAGSGGSMLNGLDVDLLFTGELSHHEALAAVEQGKCVITTLHSNSERGYLKELRNKLDLAIKTELQIPVFYGVFVSEVDRDPYEVVDQDYVG